MTDREKQNSNTEVSLTNKTSKNHIKENPKSKPDFHQITSIFQILVSSPWPLILSLIFGGCCSNVFTLESLVSEQPDSGHLLTATQFLFVSLEGYFHFFHFSRGPQKLFLADRKVPLVKWFLPVSLFFAVSLINNYVWVYHISVPVHIIFRSGGTVTTMLAGVLVGKKYSPKQILSVVILTAGVIVATLASNPGSKGKSSSVIGDENKYDSDASWDFAIGVSLLAVAATLSSVQGLVAENIYKQYGKHWRESLFYTHVLSLPFFTIFEGDIVRQFSQIMTSPRVNLIPTSLNTYISTVPGLSIIVKKDHFFSLFTSPPRRLLILLTNAITQYVCVRGVNNLAGNSTALTVSIVLNIRKFVSLLLSIYLFGNSLPFGTVIGTVFVFLGAGMYSYTSSHIPKEKAA